MTSSIKNTRYLIKQSNYWKKRFFALRIGIYIGCILLVSVFSFANGIFNIYYYFLDVPKIVISFSLFIASAYFVVGDKETYDNWSEPSYRKRVLQGKIILVIVEGIIFLIISTAILGILYLTGFTYKYEQNRFPGDPNLSPLRFSPSPLEGMLFAFIIVLQLVALYTNIYWFYARCWKVVGFNKYKNVLKINLRFIPGIIINLLLWGLSTIFLDHVYFNFIYPEAFPNNHILEGSLFASKPYLYLIVQVGILVILNLFYIVDGFLANKYRTNFIDIDPLTKVE